jgi:hypothetical protein
MSWIRKCQLFVTGGSGALDLSKMQIEFNVTQASPQENYPQDAAIRVWNLADSTSKSIMQEYQGVILQAGYEQGDYGMIFQGTIKQIRRGRMNAKDAFLDIFAADGDMARYGFASVVLPHWTTKDVWKVIHGAASQYGGGVDLGRSELPKTLDVGPEGLRGKTMYGLTYMLANKDARRTDSVWTIENGKLVFHPLDGYLKGSVIELNSNTGLVNVPEQTIEGLKAICLLNPNIKCGQLVHINQSDVNVTNVKEPGYPRFTDRPIYAATDSDGLYYVVQVEHEGDTRGHDWYTNLNCLAAHTVDKLLSPYGWRGVPQSGGSAGSSSDYPGPYGY